MKLDHYIKCNRPLVTQPPMATCQELTPDTESTHAHLCATNDLLALAIEHLKAACRDSRTDESLGEFTLDALRGIRDAIEAEMEAGNAQP